MGPKGWGSWWGAGINPQAGHGFALHRQELLMNSEATGGFECAHAHADPCEYMPTVQVLPAIGIPVAVPAPLAWTGGGTRGTGGDRG